MDIMTAERKLARWVAQQSELTPDRRLLCGELPAGIPGAGVRFTTGHTGREALSEFVAEVRGVFAEPNEARDFANAVWGKLPSYGPEGLTALIAAGDVVFAEENGWFTATGRIRTIFA